MGDFNSNYNECDKKDKHHKKYLQVTGLNSYLKTIRKESTSATNYTSERDMMDGSSGHYDLWLELPIASRMSEVFNGYNQTLDHILLPSSLFNLSGFSYIDNSFNTFTWNGKLLKGNVPYRWQFLRKGSNKNHTGEGYSDHLPIVARFHRGEFVDIIENYQTQSTTLEDTKSSTQSTHNITAPQKWTSCNNTVSLATVTSSDQKQHLHITSTPSPSNISLARRSMIITQNFLTFTLKGSGKICVRVRSANSGWIYFNAPEYKGTKTARYIDSKYSDWVTIQLDLHKINMMNPIEIEIRAGKNSPFDFEFDEFAL